MARKSTGKDRAARRREQAGPGGFPSWVVPTVVAAVVVGGFAAVLAVGAHSGSQPAPTVSAGQLREGAPPPDFTATAFDGQKVTLSSLKGHAVLLNFFASWCEQCRAEFPAIQAAYLAHHAAGFEVVGINALETGDGPAFYREMGATFPAVHDPGRPGPIAARYNVTQGLPASVFIGSDGRVDKIYPGRIDRAVIDAELKNLHVG